MDTPNYDPTTLAQMRLIAIENETNKLKLELSNLSARIGAIESYKFQIDIQILHAEVKELKKKSLEFSKIGEQKAELVKRIKKINAI